jgi:hypothetical protein
MILFLALILMFPLGLQGYWTIGIEHGGVGGGGVGGDGGWRGGWITPLSPQTTSQGLPF